MKSCAGHKGTQGGVLTLPPPRKGPATQRPSLGEAQRRSGRVGEEKNPFVPKLTSHIVQATVL